MSFLKGTPGMTLREAGEILALHELVESSLLHGPVSLELFARIVRSESDKPETWERTLRRLAASLKALGFHIEIEGDVDVREGKHKVGVTADFSVDQGLLMEIERSVDEATRKKNGSAGNGLRRFSEEDEVDLDSDCLPLTSIKKDHALGLTVKGLCRRYGIGEHHMLTLLAAMGRGREARPLRVEEKRDAEVLKAALEAPKGYGYVTGVARALGCHRDTARALIRRLRAL